MNATHNGMRKGVDERVSDSLELIAQFLTRSGQETPTESPLLDISYEGVRSFALGGKHLRSRLVHISAGDVDDDGLYAATVFGACVDLLHGAFLIHDDIIDRDDMRRGQRTIHARIRDEFGDEHLGTSVAIVAGDLGVNGALRLLSDSDLDDATVRHGLRLLTAAAHETFTGEILDIAHLANPAPDLESVRLSNHLKTSEYSFGVPLKLGALAAGRDTAPMKPIGQALGCAYQAADDIAGAIGDSRDTGKQAAGDVIHGRYTLMTMRLTGDAVNDPRRVRDVVDDVIAEGDTHLAEARSHIDRAELDPAIRTGLHSVADKIERMLRAHA
ncbi:polyprenyl synthetase family protein [Corynebacterium maris]|nr:polyprenyl synthetase family protein [Corynebacterium maris]